MYLKLFYKVVLILFLSTSFAAAQTYLFFNDSPNSTYYEYSYGTFTNPSIVVLANIDRVPVDATRKYSGMNGLRIRWKSVAGGDWKTGIGTEGFATHDVTVLDSITFYAFALAVIDSVSLPDLFLEDAQNNQTGKLHLSDIVNQIEANQWIRISIPLSFFIQSPGNADLSRIKSICLGQNNADENIHTIYLDEIIMFSDASYDVTPPAVPTGLTATAYNVLINLSWTLNTDPDLAGYRIYRSANGTDYNILASVSRITSNYNDHIGVPPQTNYYKISAFDSSLNESGYSDAVMVSTTSLPDSVLLDSVQREHLNTSGILHIRFQD